jgi:hypothetical protein
LPIAGRDAATNALALFPPFVLEKQQLLILFAFVNNLPF